MVAASFGLAAAAISTPAKGEYDPPMYVLFEHGAFNSTDDQVIAFGINNLGQCVGMVRASETGESVAYLWLPFDSYNEDAGLHNIETLTAMSSPSGTSVGALVYGTMAFDVNDEGIAVGRCWDETNGQDAAWWDLAGSTDDVLNDRGNAFSINNDEDAKFVGGVGSLWEYLISELPALPNHQSGYIYELGSGTTPLTGSGGTNAVAYGVADSFETNDAIIAGLTVSCPTAICGEVPLCNDVLDGVFWNVHSQSGGQLYPNAFIGPGSAYTAFTLGHAVSDNGYIVGFGHDGLDNSNCRLNALMWDDGPQQEPMVLPLVASGASQSELALDIRKTQSGDVIEVVGRNWTEGKAVRWRFDGSSWSVLDLSGAVSGVIDDLRGFNRLLCATAINDHGMIAVWGEQGESPIVYRSGILIPYDYYQSDVCPGDLGSTSTQHPNGVIDVFDLFILLSNWNTDDLGAALAAPTDIVNTADLFVLLGNWNCRIGSMPAANSLEDELTAVGLTMSDWNEFTSVMQDEEEDQKTKNNYKCWMQNYLSGCTTCPPCPGEDPYGE